MKPITLARVIGLGVFLGGAALGGFWLQRSAEAASARSGETNEVTLCDGETKLELDADAPKTTESGQKIADELMRKWREKNPNSDWEAEERTHHTIAPAADNSELVGQSQGQTYGQITANDVSVWKTES